MKHNLKQLMISFDQFMYCFIGTILGIFNKKIQVYADMTISAQAYRLAEKGYWYGKVLQCFINLVFFNKNHCKESYEAEIKREHIPNS